MILYDYVLSPDCYTARLIAGLTGQRLETEAVDLYPGAAERGAAFRAINPAGTLPVLLDGGLSLTEPTAILCHLAAGTGFAAEGAMAQEWLARSRHFAASLGGARLHDMLDAPGDIAALRAAGRLWLRILEAALFEAAELGHAYLLGEKPTVADIAVFPHVALAPDGGLELGAYPQIRIWMRRLRGLPGFIEMPGIHRLHDLRPEPGPDYGGAAA
jgi:glutathione S-transferase